MPAALTLILICPSPGSRSGIPAHFNTSGGPYPVITTALGIAVPSFLVAASVWPRTVFASFTVDTMFLSTTSDPWTGPRRSARAGSRSPAAPRSAASAGGRRSGRESWVHPRSVAEVEADRLHHLERRALGEDVGG